MLTKLSKTEIETQLSAIAKRAVKNFGDGAKVPFRIPLTSAENYYVVVQARTEDGRLYLCPAPRKLAASADAMGMVTGGRFRTYDTKGLAEACLESDAVEVVVGWPGHGGERWSGVTRLLAVENAEERTSTTYAFMCPYDIDEVNKEIRGYARTHGCAYPELDDCEKCGFMMDCEILERAGEESRKRREGKRCTQTKTSGRKKG